MALKFVRLWRTLIRVLRPGDPSMPEASVASSQPDKIDYVDRRDIIAMLDAEFAAYRPGYVEEKGLLGEALGRLTGRVLAFQEAGEPLYRSQQIVSEATWLLRYTCDWERLRDRLTKLEESLSTGERVAADQVALVAGKGGGFDAGATEFFQVLDNTTDAIQRSGYVPQPLTFLKDKLSPGRLLAYLHGLQTSDIRGTGINRRAELASVESSMLQFLTKPKLRGLLSDPELWGTRDLDAIAFKLIRLSETYADFLDQAQHPRTGYWGPWYLIGGELLQLHDLSFTFHIVNFRKGVVRRWPEIIETTLEIGRLGLVYPYGWRPSDSPSPYSNHHNTDVVTLLFKGRAHTSEAQRRQVASAIRAMLDWCLMMSLSPRDELRYGAFAEVDEYSTTEKYSFGIGFLDAVGYWGIDEPFWWDAEQRREPWWPDACDVARDLLAAVKQTNADSSYVEDIEAMLGPVIRSAVCGAGALA